ncbi:MAG: anti-sigma factor antagonist [Ilumatobacteraceae bacterium]|nr:anti-sigma factor antagonist [Ilumatobacteraceae bacterium]
MRSTQHHPRSSFDTAGSSGSFRAPFAIDRTATDRQAVVQVCGELDAASAPRLATALADDAVEHRDVLLDLDGTTFIDSAGIRVLVQSMWDLREAGGSLRLTTASAMAENILGITGILDVLKEPAP